MVFYLPDIVFQDSLLRNNLLRCSQGSHGPGKHENVREYDFEACKSYANESNLKKSWNSCENTLFRKCGNLVFMLISQELLTVGTLNCPFARSFGVCARAPARLMMSLWIHSQRGQNDKKKSKDKLSA